MPAGPFDEDGRDGIMALKIITTPDQAEEISNAIMSSGDTATDNIAIKRQQAQDHKGRPIVVMQIEGLDYGANEAIKSILATIDQPAIVVDEEDAMQPINLLLRDSGFRAALDDFFSEEPMYESSKKFSDFENKYKQSIEALNKLVHTLNEAKGWAHFVSTGSYYVRIALDSKREVYQFDGISSGIVFEGIIKALKAAGLKENVHFVKHNTELEGVIKSNSPKSIDVNLAALQSDSKLIESIENLTTSLAAGSARDAGR